MSSLTPNTRGATANITVQIAKEFTEIDLDRRRMRRLVRAVCRNFGLTRATVSIAVVSDAQFRDVNKRFLNRRSSSDCLSFDLSDRTEADSPAMFELVVNAETAVRQARLRGHSSQAELALYVTHGLLHNLGFNDAKPVQARQMHETQDRILQELGYGSVYNTKIRSAKLRR